MSATNKAVRIGESAETQCAVADQLVSLFGDKWLFLVLGVLGRAPSLRYKEIQHSIRGISQRMLTLTLKKLEANGLVKRTVFATVPPRVDYELTPVGRTLIKPLKALLEWTAVNRPAMVEARNAYANTAARKTA